MQYKIQRPENTLEDVHCKHQSEIINNLMQFNSPCFNKSLATEIKVLTCASLCHGSAIISWFLW